MKLNEYLKTEDCKKFLSDLLGEHRAKQFSLSVRLLADGVLGLNDADPILTLKECLKAEALGFSLSSKLPECYIELRGKNVPEFINGKTIDKWIKNPVLQLQWQGLLALAIRSGNLLKVSAIPIYDKELIFF